jgi:hypothetical protein
VGFVEHVGQNTIKCFVTFVKLAKPIFCTIFCKVQKKYDKLMQKPHKAQKDKPAHSVKQGVCHTVALPFTLKSILRQKKNYGNSNIAP